MPLPSPLVARARPIALVPGLACGLALLAAVQLGGCGHPATSSECEQIVDKIVELELKAQNVKDAQAIEQRKTETRAARGKELLAQCQGRKVTDAAMRCVRGAQSYDEIDNVCLR
jgi:hypothetical protein